MNILVIGDIVGKPGRKAITELVPVIKDEFNIDVVIANGENTAGGSGVTEKTLSPLYSAGVDVVTTGDHIWRKKETAGFIDDYSNLLRPCNYPPGVKGKGSVIISVGDKKIGVVNAIGRVFMQPIDCPFRAVKVEIEKLKKETNIIIFDFHAEATSEKVAMGWYLNGEVSAVVGTHTHVATADETILNKGTAYITDIGMTGSMDSVIGRKKEPVLQKFLTQVPARFDLAVDDVKLNGVIIEIDENSGKAVKIERISRRL